MRSLCTLTCARGAVFAPPLSYPSPSPLTSCAHHAINLVNEYECGLPRRRHLEQSPHQLLTVANPPACECEWPCLRRVVVWCICEKWCGSVMRVPFCLWPADTKVPLALLLASP